MGYPVWFNVGYSLIARDFIHYVAQQYPHTNCIKFDTNEYV